VTDWGHPGGEPTPADPYQGPPRTAPYTPPTYGSGQPGSPVYPTAGYPAPQPPANPYAQMPPYGYGYPPGYGPQPGDGRPGTTIAAAVLGYVGGGLLILAGVLLFFGASFVTSIDNASGNDHGGFAGQLSLLGVVNLVAAGLLIAGSVSLTGRSARGRSMYSIGAAIVVVLSVIWTAWWADRSGGGVVVYALLFAAIVIVGLCLAWTRAVTAWLGGAKRA
jgi:hypothetical protein